jgi:predicted transcriptional regulator
MLGFVAVYDYAEGKSDWMAAWLPFEGENTLAPYAGDAMRADAATCKPADRADRLREFGDDGRCFVLNERGVVLGSVRRADAAKHGRAPVSAWMTEGPTTIRANERLADVVPRMHEANVKLLPVTNPDGKLLGILRREAATHMLHVAHE